MSQVIEQVVQREGHVESGRWMVLICNNDYNSFDEVVAVLQLATQCSLEEAYIEAWEAHTYGKAPCHFDTQDECERVARIIQKIGVLTEVRMEWGESA